MRVRRYGSAGPLVAVLHGGHDPWNERAVREESFAVSCAWLGRHG